MRCPGASARMSIAERCVVGGDFVTKTSTVSPSAKSWSTITILPPALPLFGDAVFSAWFTAFVSSRVDRIHRSRGRGVWSKGCGLFGSSLPWGSLSTWTGRRLCAQIAPPSVHGDGRPGLPAAQAARPLILSGAGSSLVVRPGRIRGGTGSSVSGIGWPAGHPVTTGAATEGRTRSGSRYQHPTS